MHTRNPLRNGARGALLAATALAAAYAGPAFASSHREAPFISGEPRLDSTDTYMFRSYEPGRQDYTTLIANYIPLQDPFGGPNYYTFDDQAVYDINLDNVGDGLEHITFRFSFQNAYQGITVKSGNRRNTVPVENVGPVGVGGNPADTANLNLKESYKVQMLRTQSGSVTTGFLAAASDGSTTFTKPIDNIGAKSLPDYAAFAAHFVYTVNIPGCGEGRVFVGQRKDPFVIALGQVFDLINVAHPIGEQFAAANHDDLADKNVTAIELEVPTHCLVANDPVIGMWTAASKKIFSSSDPSVYTLQQHSRLGMPLTNELLIGIEDKDRWNAARPAQQDGGAFLKYVTNPAFPIYVQNIFFAAGVRAPTVPTRDDLVATFLTGIPGVNKPANANRLADELRLNTSLAITPAGAQSRLGVIGGDVGGFPNGRRPGDDVVDIALRVAMGRLYTLGLFGKPSDAPSGGLDFTDGAIVNDGFFDTKFPYLRTPIAGSPGPQPN